MSGQKSDTEESYKQEAKINREKGIALEVTGATDKNPVVNIDKALEGAYRPWEEVQARTRNYLKLNWPHTTHNSSREINIIIKKFLSSLLFL